jgi:hypothetical protein
LFILAKGENVIFLARYVGQSDLHWRALNARTESEARAQAVQMAAEDAVEYGLVDLDRDRIVSLGVVAAPVVDRASAP